MASMRFYQALIKLLSAKSLPDAELRLGLAYQRVFSGSPTDDDQRIVMVDLADFSGFYRVTSTADGRDEIVFNEGKRAAYARIFRYLRMSAEEMASLETAARETAAHREALASNQQ
jgi:hypothetical protein